MSLYTKLFGRREPDSDEEDEELMKNIRSQRVATLVSHDMEPGSVPVGKWHMAEETVVELWGEHYGELRLPFPELTPMDMERIAFGHKWEYENIKTIPIALWQKVIDSEDWFRDKFVTTEVRGMKRDIMLDLFDSNPEFLKQSKIKEKLTAMLMVGRYIQIYRDTFSTRVDIKDVVRTFDIEAIKKPEEFEKYFKRYTM